MGIESDHSETYGLDELLARARAGEGQAFCQLAAQHEARLFQQACGLIHDSSAAEDLVSETLVEAWRSLPRFNGSCRFSTWLFSILLHRYATIMPPAGLGRARHASLERGATGQPPATPGGPGGPRWISAGNSGRDPSADGPGGPNPCFARGPPIDPHKTYGHRRARHPFLAGLGPGGLSERLVLPGQSLALPPVPKAQRLAPGAGVAKPGRRGCLGTPPPHGSFYADICRPASRRDLPHLQRANPVCQHGAASKP